MGRAIVVPRGIAQDSGDTQEMLQKMQCRRFATIAESATRSIGRRDAAGVNNDVNMSSPSRFVALALVIAALLTIPVVAEYVALETENVPVDRLVKNLEALVAASPDDARLKFNLARLHAMAFARKDTEVPIWKGHEKEGVYFGHD